MATIQTLTVPQLQMGMIVRQHGGRFRVLEDARPSTAHVTPDGVGPSDCAVAQSECLKGHVPHYFQPGSAWTLQGNRLAVVCVEIQAL